MSHGHTAHAPLHRHPRANGRGCGLCAQGADIRFQYTLNGLPVAITVHYYRKDPPPSQSERLGYSDFTVEVRGDTR